MIGRNQYMSMRRKKIEISVIYMQLNPSEVFGDIMIDHSYNECSMGSMTGLAMFHEQYDSNHCKQEIKDAIRKSTRL